MVSRLPQPGICATISALHCDPGGFRRDFGAVAGSASESSQRRLSKISEQ
jgi:hypothetical protein